jgi:hypothetical protein
MRANVSPEERITRVFVSGTVPSTLPEEGQEAWATWWATPYGRWRLSIEIEAMKRFPSFRLGRDGADLCWEGRLRSALTGKSYDVKVVYPFGFPDMAPVATIENHQFPDQMPHLQYGNRPCLFTPDHGSRSGYDPARTTVATIVAWTALWVHAYETWRATGRWPGLER